MCYWFCEILFAVIVLLCVRVVPHLCVVSSEPHIGQWVLAGENIIFATKATTLLV